MQPDQTVQKKGLNIKIIVIVLVGVAVLSIGGFVILNNINSQFDPEPNPPPVKVTPAPDAFTTSLILSATNTSYAVGDKIVVSLMAKSDNDAANLFVAKMHFPKDLLQVVNIDFKSGTESFISDWFVTNWVENTYDNNTGTISLVGGVPNPGYKTDPASEGALMADIILEAKRGGSATIAFDATSSVYRNFDNANILKTKKDLTLQITEATSTASPTPSTGGVIPAPTPTSEATPSVLLEGDVNGDTKVDLTDLSALLTFWNKSGSEVGKADLNKDTVVNTFDFSALSNILIKLGVISTN